MHIASLFFNRDSCFDHDSFFSTMVLFSTMILVFDHDSYFPPCFYFPSQPRHHPVYPVLAWHDPAHHTADVMHFAHHHRVAALAVSTVRTATGPGRVQCAHDGSMRAFLAGKDGKTPRRHQSIPVCVVGTPELAVAPLLGHGRATLETCVRELMPLVVRVPLHVPQTTATDTLVLFVVVSILFVADMYKYVPFCCSMPVFLRFFVSGRYETATYINVVGLYNLSRSLLSIQDDLQPQRLTTLVAVLVEGVIG
jgi:hypothetical protein